MNKWIAVALVLLVASPLAVVALDSMGIGPGFNEPAPTWESGYAWTYDVTAKARAQGQIFGLVSGATEEARFEATRRAEVLNTTLEEDGVGLYGVLEALRVDRVLYGSEVLYDGKTDDYAASNDHADDMATDFACFTPCGTGLVPYTRDHLNPYTGVVEEGITDQVRLLDFPLTRDKEWSVIAGDEEGMHLEIRARAVEKEYINPPGLAPVEAIRIEAELTEASKEAIKALAHGEAAEEDIDLDTDFDLRFTYWYSPKVKNIVQIDTTAFFSMRASGMGIAGSGRVDFSLSQTLDKYTLTEKPERSLAESYALASIAQADGGDTTETSTLTPWSFTAVASKLSVGAQDAPQITLGTIDGQTDDQATTGYGNPRDLRIEWTHRHWDGNKMVTEALSGDVADATIGDPGLHEFTARAFDGQGRLVGADTVVVEGYTVTTCSPPEPVAAGVLVKTTYAACDVRTAPGLFEMTVSKVADLHAEGIATVSYEGEDIAVSDLEEGLVIGGNDQPGRWIIAWEDQLRVGELDIIAEVHYDRNNAPSAQFQSGGLAFLDDPLVSRLTRLL